MTQIFLTSIGPGSFPQPYGFVSFGAVSVIGAGGNGVAGNGSRAGGGGGGGAFATAPTTGLAFPVPYYVAAGGAGTGNTSWGKNTLTFGTGSAGMCSAANGVNGNAGSGGAGGVAASCYPTTGAFKGGAGGNSASSFYSGGGGGAAGPNGAGGAGAGANPNGTGGTGDAGNTPAESTGGQGLSGVNGTQWGGAGSGSGGNGDGNFIANGGVGGYFGGGGGGGYSASSSAGGVGASGLIVVNFTTTGVTQVFLTTVGAGSCPAPPGWNAANNQVECIGCGGFAIGGGGGGGGAYAITKNSAPTFPVPYYISNYGDPYTAGAATNWGVNTITGGGGATGRCSAATGAYGATLAGSAGGLASACYPTAGAFSGGKGGDGGGPSGNYTSGGGGGAAGPYSSGLPGQTGNYNGGNPYGGLGGASGGGGAGGAGASSTNNTPGATGGSGTEWGSNGSGGGGGGGWNNSAQGGAGAGGLYGGGGGGAGNSGSYYNYGGSGLIVLSYVKVAPAASTTWDPATIGPSTTLSNYNLTAALARANAGARSNAYQKVPGSGKYYFEVSADVVGQSSIIGFVGVADENALYANSPNDPLSQGIWTGGDSIYSGSNEVGSLDAYVGPGDILCFAFDLANKKFWIRINSTPWNSSTVNGNPATNTGGFDVVGTNISPFISNYYSDSIQATLGAGGYAFQFAAPSGFVAWPLMAGGAAKASAIIMG